MRFIFLQHGLCRTPSVLGVKEILFEIVGVRVLTCSATAAASCLALSGSTALTGALVVDSETTGGLGGAEVVVLLGTLTKTRVRKHYTTEDLGLHFLPEMQTTLQPINTSGKNSNRGE